MGLLGATLAAPLRGYARFGGRSTRFELILFVLLIVLLSSAIGYLDLVFEPYVSEWGGRILVVLVACPMVALMIRRLHDTGRSGWWLAIGLPLLGFRLWEAWLLYNDPLALSPIDELPLLARLALALTGLALAVLLLWDDEDGDNRYGANPRYSPAEALA